MAGILGTKAYMAAAQDRHHHPQKPQQHGQTARRAVAHVSA
jgi:hypothetical protein